MFKTILLDICLSEGLEDVKKSYNEREHPIIDYIHKNILPDSNKSDRLLHHAVKTIFNDDTNSDNTNITVGNRNIVHIADKDDYKHAYNIVARYGLQNRLNGVSSLHELKSLVKPYQDRYNDELEKKSSKVVYEDDKCVVKRHDTYESAQVAAKLHPDNQFVNATKVPGKANWCVSMGDDAGRHYFENVYTENGKHPMYTLEDKHSKRKYAIIGDKNTRLSRIEMRDELDGMTARDIITNHYPKVLAGKGEFSDFARHIFVNQQFERAMSGSRRISDDEFKGFIDNNLTPITSDSGAVINSLHRYSELEHGKNVKEYYSKILDNKVDDHDTEALHSKIIRHIDLDKNTINKYFKDHYDPHDVFPELGMSEVMRHRNLDIKHVKDVLNNPNSNIDLLQGAVKNPGLTKDELIHEYKNHSFDVKTHVLKNQNVDDELLNKLYNHHLSQGISNDSLDDYTFSGIKHVLAHPELSKESVDRIYHNTDNYYVKAQMINHPNASPELHSEYRSNIFKKGILADNDVMKVRRSYLQSSPATLAQFTNELHGISKQQFINVVAPHKDSFYEDYPEQFKKIYDEYRGNE